MVFLSPFPYSLSRFIPIPFSTAIFIPSNFGFARILMGIFHSLSAFLFHSRLDQGPSNGSLSFLLLPLGFPTYLPTSWVRHILVRARTISPLPDDPSKVMAKKILCRSTRRLLRTRLLTFSQEVFLNLSLKYQIQVS